MLGKLLKYDLKSRFKHLAIFYGLAVFFAILTRLLFLLQGSIFWNVVGHIMSGTTIAMIANIVINNLMWLWVRFKANLYGDESYLTHTLPVKRSDLYLSKFLVGVITVFTSTLVIFGVVMLAYYTPENFVELKTMLMPFAEAMDTTVVKMILALDIGNTNIVIGCCTDDKILFTERISTNQSATEFEYAMIIKNILEIYDIKPDQITGAIISCVVPSLKNILKNAIEKSVAQEALIVGPGIKTGVKIACGNPAQLGADLVVDTAAGINCYGAPIIIVDMGTATTISAVGEDGSYLGTVIMPGVMISLNSLVGGTAQLPKISLEKPDTVIGTNTVDWMKTGIK